MRGIGIAAQPVNNMLAIKMEPDSEELALEAELKACPALSKLALLSRRPCQRPARRSTPQFCRLSSRSWLLGAKQSTRGVRVHICNSLKVDVPKMEPKVGLDHFARFRDDLLRFLIAKTVAQPFVIQNGLKQ